MGIIIFYFMLLVEVAFAAYCISTRSYQTRLKNWIKVGFFVLLSLLALVAVIDWSLSWDFIALLLLIRAIVGAVGLIRNRKDTKDYKTGRIIVRFVVRVSLFSLALAPALLSAPSALPQTTGAYPVSTVNRTMEETGISETFRDTGDRSVNVEFFYPANADGRYPLIVYSHGAFGMKEGNASTLRELASNGYVVCAIDHPYHALMTKSDDGNITYIDGGFLKEFMDINKGAYDEKTTLNLQHKWLKLRTQDMNFVLDDVLRNAREENACGVYRLIDTGHIGLIGHSLGGAACVQLGRERSDIDAAINLDGDMLGEYLSVENGVYRFNPAPYTIPLLNIYTDDLKKGFDKVAAEGVDYPQKHISSGDPNAYDVFLPGTNHLSLTDLPITAPFVVSLIRGQMNGKIGEQTVDPATVIRTMNQTVLRFFNSFLKNRGTFSISG